jgi:hypothetical protein
MIVKCGPHDPSTLESCGTDRHSDSRLTGRDEHEASEPAFWKHMPRRGEPGSLTRRGESAGFLTRSPRIGRLAELCCYVQIVFPWLSNVDLHVTHCRSRHRQPNIHPCNSSIPPTPLLTVLAHCASGHPSWHSFRQSSRQLPTVLPPLCQLAIPPVIPLIIPSTIPFAIHTYILPPIPIPIPMPPPLSLSISTAMPTTFTTLAQPPCQPRCQPLSLPYLSPCLSSSQPTVLLIARTQLGQSHCQSPYLLPNLPPPSQPPALLTAMSPMTMCQAPGQAPCQGQTAALPHGLSWDGGHRPTVNCNSWAWWLGGRLTTCQLLHIKRRFILRYSDFYVTQKERVPS